MTELGSVDAEKILKAAAMATTLGGAIRPLAAKQEKTDVSVFNDDLENAKNSAETPETKKVITDTQKQNEEAETKQNNENDSIMKALEDAEVESDSEDDKGNFLADILTMGLVGAGIKSLINSIKNKDKE